MKKKQVVDMINDFPKEFKLDDLVEKLIFMDKVERGMKQVKEGKTITHDKVVKEIRKWPK